MLYPPKWLYWLLGKRVSIINLITFLGFSALVTVLLIVNSTDVFLAWPWYWQIVYTILAFFTFFSVGINLTLELSKIYETSRKNKLIYILLSVQPLILYLIDGTCFWCYFGVWIYTVVVSLFILLFNGRPTQKAIGFGAMVLALLLFSFYFKTMSGIYSIVLLAYLTNVLFSVAVSQYLEYKY